MKKIVAMVAVLAAILGFAAIRVSGVAVASVAVPNPVASVAGLHQKSKVSLDHDAIVVEAGDSITAGGLLAPPDRIDARMGYRLCGRQCGTPGYPTILNKGIGGQQLTVGSPSLPSLVTQWPSIINASPKPDIIFMRIGMNDLYNYPGDAVWTAAYVGLVQAANALGIIVVPCQITPVGPSHSNVVQLWVRLNQWIIDHFGNAAIERSPDVLIGPTWPWIDSQKVFSDGTHPNAFGTMQMGDMDADRFIQLVG